MLATRLPISRCRPTATAPSSWRSCGANPSSSISTRRTTPRAAPPRRAASVIRFPITARPALRFMLASDADGKVTERYGVWVEKSMYGRKYMGIERATFLIDKDGVVRKIWHKVKVPGHVAEVLQAVKAL